MTTVPTPSGSCACSGATQGSADRANDPHDLASRTGGRRPLREWDRFEATLANLALGKPLVLKVVGDLAWERATARGWSGEAFEAFQMARPGPRLRSSKGCATWWTRRADQIIVPSRYLARWVMAWGVPEDQITVIYNAVAPPNGFAVSPAPLATPVNLVTAGRLVQLKRVGGILEAIAGMQGCRPDQ